MPSMRGPNKPTFNKQLLLVPLAFLALILFYNSLGAAPSPQLHGRDFAVVFDAGSSGSRVHVFQFIELANGQHELEQEYFKQLKPGLSSYKTDAVAAADSLTPLLEYAVEKVPSAQHGITPIIVRATAGLRMLPGEQAERILNAVAQKLQGYDFKLQGPDEDVKIMDGEDEGIYAWLSVNYLLKRVGKTAEHTVSTIDLGGGSTQIAYAADPEHDPTHQLHKLKVAGQTYHIWTHSYLGFGLNTARHEVNNMQGLELSGPCVPSQGEVAQLSACQTKVNNFVTRGFSTLAAPHDLSSTAKQLPVFVLSFIYDVAEEMELLQQPMQSDEPIFITLTDFLKAAERVCGMTLAQVQKLPKLNRRDDEVKLLCFDLVYISGLLSQGYHRTAEDVLHAGKAIELNQHPIETQWPLGAGLLIV